MALQKLSAASFPAKEAFALAKALAKLRSNADVIATDEARRACATRHGKDNGQGQTVVPPENFAAFIAEYEPIASQEIELDIEPLPLSILDHAPEMTPEDMLALMDLWLNATEIEVRALPAEG